MNKDIIDFLILYQKWLLFFFCVLLGVSGKESFHKIKTADYKINKIGYKFVVAFMVCFTMREICEHFGWIRFQPHIIIFTSCFHEPIMDWIIKDVLPALGKVVVSLITKRGGDDGTGT